MKREIEASIVFEFLAALGVEDPKRVRSVGIDAGIDPIEVTVHMSANRLGDDGGLLVSEHRIRIERS